MIDLLTQKRELIIVGAYFGPADQLATRGRTIDWQAAYREENAALLQVPDADSLSSDNTARWGTIRQRVGVLAIVSMSPDGTVGPPWESDEHIKIVERYRTNAMRLGIPAVVGLVGPGLRDNIPDAPDSFSLGPGAFDSGDMSRTGVVRMMLPSGEWK